eukprot:2661166-Lingulodinium_polyedra.AAC.1
MDSIATPELRAQALFESGRGVIANSSRDPVAARLRTTARVLQVWGIRFPPPSVEAVRAVAA